MMRERMENRMEKTIFGICPCGERIPIPKDSGKQEVTCSCCGRTHRVWIKDKEVAISWERYSGEIEEIFFLTCPCGEEIPLPETSERLGSSESVGFTCPRCGRSHTVWVERKGKDIVIREKRYPTFFLMCPCGEEIPIPERWAGEIELACPRCGLVHRGYLERREKIISEETYPSE